MSKRKDLKSGNKNLERSSKRKMQFALFLGIIVLAIAAYFMINNGYFRDTKKKVLTLEERVIEYNNRAEKILESIKVEMAKPVSPYKFILSSLKESERYTWMALDIDTTFADAWIRLGYINSHIHGKQALLRYESYKKQEKPDKVVEEEKNAVLYFSKAKLYYGKALEFGTNDSSYVYFMMSEAAEIQHLYERSAINLRKAIQLEGRNRKYEAKLIEAFLKAGRFQLALNEIERYKQAYPDSDIPYIHLAGYFYNTGDTISAIQNYETAIEKGTKPEVGKFLHRYYTQHGDPAKAEFYLQKAYDAEANYNPEKY